MGIKSAVLRHGLRMELQDSYLYLFNNQIYKNIKK